jgi:hypothetical protein
MALEEKRDILAHNLLQNSVEAGDILLETSTVPSCSLPFPDITMTQIEKAVLHVENIIPESDELSTSILKTA